MDFKETFIAFSGDKQISSRDTDLQGYYDDENPEIDDSEFIKANKITTV